MRIRETRRCEAAVALCPALFYTMWRSWFIKCDIATCCKSNGNGVSVATKVLLGELWAGLCLPGRWPAVKIWMESMLECTCRHIYTCTPIQMSPARPYLHQLWGTSWHSQSFRTEWSGVLFPKWNRSIPSAEPCLVLQPWQCISRDLHQSEEIVSQYLQQDTSCVQRAGLG